MKKKTKTKVNKELDKERKEKHKEKMMKERELFLDNVKNDKSKTKETQSKYLPQSIIDMLYSSPHTFVNSMSNEMPVLIFNNQLKDKEDNSLLMHYIIAYESASSSNESEVYSKNIIPFFKLMKDVLHIGDRQNETFLHQLAKKRNKNLFFNIYSLLIDNNLMTESLMQVTDSSNMRCYDYLFNEFKDNLIQGVFSNDSNNELYKQYSEFINRSQNYIPKEEAVFINAYLNQDSFNLRKLSDKSSKEEQLTSLIQLIKRSLDLFIHMTYYPDISFNLLNYLIDHNDIQSALAIVSEFNHISSLNNNVDMIVNAFIYMIAKGKTIESESMEYLSTLITIIKKSNKSNCISLLKRQRTKSRMNIYHHLFNNPYLNSNSKITLFNYLNEEIFNNSDEEIRKVLSQQDFKGIYPIVYYLTSITIPDSNKAKEEAKQFFLTQIGRSNISMKSNDSNNHPSKLLLACLDPNKQTNISIILNYLILESKLDLFYFSKRNKNVILSSIVLHCKLNQPNFDSVFNHLLSYSNIISSEIKSKQALKYIITIIDFANHNLDNFNDKSLCSLLDFIEKNYESNRSEFFGQYSHTIKTLTNLKKKSMTKYLDIESGIQDSIIKESLVFIKAFQLFVKKIIRRDYFNQDSISQCFKTLIQIIPPQSLIQFFYDLFENDNVFFDDKYNKVVKAYVLNCHLIVKKYLIFDQTLDEYNISVLYLSTMLLLILLNNTHSYINEQGRAKNYGLQGGMFIYFSILKHHNSLNHHLFYNFLPFNQLLLTLNFLTKTQLDYVYDTVLSKLSPDFNQYYSMANKLYYDNTNIDNAIALSDAASLIRFSNVFFVNKYNECQEFYLSVLSYINFKFNNIPSLYTYILKGIAESKLILEEEIETIKKGISYFIDNILPILNLDDISIDQELILAKNMIFIPKKQSLLFQACQKDKDNKASKLNKRLRKYIMFIKSNSKRNGFALMVIHNKTIPKLFNEPLELKESNDLLNLYLLNEVTNNNNDDLKREIISYFNPCYHVLKPFDYLISLSSKLISYNPFLFLLHCTITETNYEVYSEFLNQINKDQRMLYFKSEQSSKYIQPSFDSNSQSINRNEKKLNQLISNLNILTIKMPQIKELIGNTNISFNAAFCYLLYNSLFNFQLRKIPQIDSLIDILIRFEVVSYNSKFSRLLLLILIRIVLRNENTLANNSTHLIKSIKDKVLTIIPALPLIYYQHLSPTIKQMIAYLLSYRDIEFFDLYIRNIISSFKASIVSSLLKDQSLLILVLSYFIFRDDTKTVIQILNIINITPNIDDNQKDTNESINKAKTLFTSPMSLNSLFLFQSISKCNNCFTKFLFKYNKSTLFYLAIISSSQSIINYIADNYVSFDDLRDINQALSSSKSTLTYDLRKSIFASKNINYFFEFKELIQFQSFLDNDYYYLSRLYQDKKYYDTFIKAIASYFPQFDFIVMFISCVVNDNKEMATLIFNSFSIKIKVSLLSYKNMPNQTKKNIIHFLVIKQHNAILAELIALVKQYPNSYYNLELHKSDNIKTTSLTPNKQAGTKPCCPKSPLMYAVMYHNYEAFALLNELYPKKHISEVLKKYDNIMPSYFEFFKNESNKQKIKEHSPNLYLISETIISLKDYLDSLELNYNYHKEFDSFAFILLTNPHQFTLFDDKDFEKLLFNANKPITFGILYVFIIVLNIFPSKEVFDFMFSETNYKQFKRCAESTIIFILNSMEKIGFKIFSMKKYISINYGDEYYKKIDVNRIDSFKEYKKIISKKTKNYTENQNIQKKIAKNPLSCLIKVVQLGYFNIAYALISEYAIIPKLIEITTEESIILEKLFLSFQYQVVNYFDNIKAKDIKKKISKKDNKSNETIFKEVFNEEWDIIRSETKCFFDMLSNFNQYFILKANTLKKSKITQNNAYEDIIKDILYVRSKILLIIEPNSLYSQYMSTIDKKAFSDSLKQIDLKQISNLLYSNYVNAYKDNKLTPNHVHDYHTYYFNSNYIQEQVQSIDSSSHQPSIKFFLKLNLYLEYIDSFTSEMTYFNKGNKMNKISKLIYAQSKEELCSVILKQISISFKYEEEGDKAKGMMKQNWNHISELFGYYINSYLPMNKTSPGQYNEVNIIFPYYFNANAMKVFDPIINKPLKYSVDMFMQRVIDLLTIILHNDFLSLIVLSYPSVYFPSAETIIVEKSIEEASKFEKQINDSISSLSQLVPNMYKIITYLYTFISTKKIQLSDLINNEAYASFLFLLQFYIPITLNELKALFTYSFIRKETQSLFFNVKNYCFRSCEDIISNQCYNSKCEYPQLKPIEFLYPNNAEFISKLNSYANQLHSVSTMVDQYNGKDIILNYFQLGRLIDRYIKVNPLANLNKHLDETQQSNLLEKISVDLKNFIFYKDNSITNAIGQLASRLKKQLLLTEPIIIEFSNEINLTNTIEFNSVEVLDHVFDVNRIEYDVEKNDESNKMEIKMIVIIEGCQIKIAMETDLIEKMLEGLVYYKFPVNTSYDKLFEDKFIEEQINEITKANEKWTESNN